MTTLRLISLFFIVGGLMISCEKFELEDHCPEEEEFFVPNVNPGDVKNLQGTDAGESNSYFINSTINGDLLNPGESRGDDLINDDSDNEDEGQAPRTEGFDGNSVGGQK